MVGAQSGRSVRTGKVSMFACYTVCSTIPCTTMLSGSAGACRCWSKRSTCYHITSHVLIPRLLFLGVHISFIIVLQVEVKDLAQSVLEDYFVSRGV